MHVSGAVIIGASRNEGSDTIVPVPNLLPGTHYEIDVFSSIGKDGDKQTSIAFANTTGYTGKQELSHSITKPMKWKTVVRFFHCILNQNNKTQIMYCIYLITAFYTNIGTNIYPQT